MTAHMLLSTQQLNTLIKVAIIRERLLLKYYAAALGEQVVRGCRSPIFIGDELWRKQ